MKRKIEILTAKPRTRQNEEGKFRGVALPFGERSRNGNLYDKESAVRSAKKMIGRPVLWNHDESIPAIGHVENFEEKDGSLNYEIDLDLEDELAKSVSRKLERGDISHVSIGAIVEDSKTKEGALRVDDFVELTVCNVPGFEQTDARTVETFSSTTERKTGKEAIRHDLYELFKREVDDENPCWDGYMMVGTKQLNGKTVPRCVPERLVDKCFEECYNEDLSVEECMERVEKLLNEELQRNSMKNKEEDNEETETVNEDTETERVEAEENYDMIGYTDVASFVAQHFEGVETGDLEGVLSEDAYTGFMPEALAQVLAKAYGVEQEVAMQGLQSLSEILDDMSQDEEGEDEEGMKNKDGDSEDETMSEEANEETVELLKQYKEQLEKANSRITKLEKKGLTKQTEKTRVETEGGERFDLHGVMRTPMRKQTNK